MRHEGNASARALEHTDGTGRGLSSYLAIQACKYVVLFNRICMKDWQHGSVGLYIDAHKAPTNLTNSSYTSPLCYFD